VFSGESLAVVSSVSSGSRLAVAAAWGLDEVEVIGSSPAKIREAVAVNRETEAN
jgi:hypothetical protein